MLTLLPGPDILYVFSQSLIGGAKRGILIAAGLCSGLVIHTILIALGLGVIISSNELMFDIIKYLGGCYLLYLAYMTISSIWKSNKENNKPQQQEALQKGNGYYKKGFIMNILNPKIIIFFLSLFPPFITDKANAAENSIILGAIFIAIAFTIFSTISIFASAIGNKFMKESKNSKITKIIEAAVYIGIAVLIIVG